MNLSGSSKRRVDVLSRVLIFLTECAHLAVSLALVMYIMYACSNSAMSLLSCACLGHGKKIHCFSGKNFPTLGVGAQFFFFFFN